jgi:hypothetical protein
MFGLDPEMPIRYVENARQLLIMAAEEHDPAMPPGASRQETAARMLLSS